MSFAERLTPEQALEELKRRKNKRKMTINEYQEKAIATAIYPEQYKIIYPALGLAGETGEVIEKIKKILRDEDSNVSEEKRQELKKEMGDVMWYLAALARDLQFTLDEVAQTNLTKLADRHNRNVIQGNGDER